MAEFRICSIEGCGNRHAGHGYCNKHLKRFRAHGDPLVFLKKKSSNGAPGAFLKRHLSEIHAFDECVIWPFARTDQGYPQIRIRAVTQYVHRIVCKHHHGPAPSEAQKALHSCGNGHLGCINEQHLRWGTMVENQSDSRAHGTMTLGEQVHSAKLTADNVIALRSGRFAGMSQRAAAAHLNVSQRTVSDILTGKTWRHLL